MNVDLREAEAPGPADLSYRVGRDLVGAGHLQYAAGLNLEELSNYFFIDEGLEDRKAGLGKGGL